MKGIWGWLIALVALVAVGVILANLSPPPLKPTPLGEMSPLSELSLLAWPRDTRVIALANSSTARSWETVIGHPAREAVAHAAYVVAAFDPEAVDHDLSSAVDRVLDQVFVVADRLRLDPVALLREFGRAAPDYAADGSTQKGALTRLAAILAVERRDSIR